MFGGLLTKITTLARKVVVLPLGTSGALFSWGRNNNGQFYSALQNMHTFFWSTSETITSSRVHYRGLYHTSGAVDNGGSALLNGNKTEGASIRCLKD